MSNDPNQPSQGGWRFDPQTGQPIGQPPPPPTPSEQPQEQVYVPPASANTTPAPPPPQPHSYTAPPADPNAQPGYRAQPEPYAPPTQPYAPAPQVNVNAPKKRGRTGLVVGLVVLVLLVAGAAGAYYFLNKTLNRPAVAVERILPANALGYFSVAPVLDGNQKAAMDKMKEAFQSQPGFSEAWNKITSQATDLGQAMGMATPGATPGVGNLDALASYLGGNLTIAVLPPSTDDLQKLKDASSNGEDVQKVGSDVLGRNVVGMVDLDFNPLDKKGPLLDFKRQADNVGKLELVEKYRDMDIRKYVTGTTTLFFTLLDGSSTAVLAVKVEPLKTAVDGFKDNKGLKDDANFKVLSGQVPSDRIASLYLNLTGLYKQAGLMAPETANTVQKVDGAMLMTLSARDDGMQVDIASQVDFANSALGGSSVQINPNAKPDVATLADIPAGSLAFLLGTDLKSVVKSALDAARKQGGDAASSIQSVEDQVKQATGKDLEADILPLMGGDYALSATSAKAGAQGVPVSAVVFQMKLKPGDRDKALQIINSLATNGTDGGAQKFEAAGGTFYSMSGDSPSSPVLGVAGDRVLLVVGMGNDTTSRDQLSAVTSGLGKGVGTTDAWRATAKRLPDGSNLIGYVDFAGIRSAAEQTMSSSSKQQYEQNAAPFLRPFKYLLIGSSSQAPTTGGTLSRNHTVLFLAISK